MVRIAERLAVANGCGALITGESLGQVASQTVAGITSTEDAVETLPVFYLRSIASLSWQYPALSALPASPYADSCDSAPR